MKKHLCISIVMALLVSGCADAPKHPSALPLCYRNQQYGLAFFLPARWQGYSVLVQRWEGGAGGPEVTAHGPMIVLRHPRWKADDPYQDIPIMVFTRGQWDGDKQGRFSFGAGGFDEELWHNQDYVFAMSSRYNAADDVKGWEEVSEVVEQNKAAHRMPRLHPQ